MGIRVLFTQLTNKAGGARSQLDDLRLLHAKHQTTEQRGGSVIKMYRGLLCATQGLKGADDQIFPRLREHLNGDVIRDAVLFNQLANKVEVRL